MAITSLGILPATVETAAALRRQIDLIADKPPEQLAGKAELEERLRFMRAALGDEVDAARSFERVIAGNELQPVSYLERGMVAARAVARVTLRNESAVQTGFGTGFLIAPGVLLTNNHVLPDANQAARAEADFQYEVDLADRAIGPVRFALAPARLFHTDRALDFTVVAVAPVAEDGRTMLAGFGCLPLLPNAGKASEGEWLTIIQHPEGARKQICVRDNKLLKRTENHLWYSTDTKPGSSGSPVFNNDWYVVALHHAGVPALVNDVPQSIDGGDFLPGMPPERQKWIGNEGIRASQIHRALRARLPDHPMLLPLYAATPGSARITTTRAPSAAEPSAVSPVPPLHRETHPMATQTITVPVQITVTIPDGSLAGLPAIGVAGRESADSTAEAARRTPVPRIEAPFDPDYSKRKGFQPNFLDDGKALVGLPVLGPQNELEAATLLKPVAGNQHVLHYENSSIVMHARRKLAMYSAANVSFGNRYEMGRAVDVWRTDPRIAKSAQLEGWYYARNQFDRGHLTRREDLEYGPTPKAALMSAGDTCHWTNCAPQHARFNQNREIWHGIERYILEESIKEGRFHANIFTGPVLDEGDPEYQDIQYPLQFWKIVAALRPNGELFATAYIASQEEVIAKYGIETTDAPFGAYKTFQTPIAEIERLTGLTFVCGANGKTPLRDKDPLATRAPRRRRASVRESTFTEQIPANYREVASLDDVVF